MHIIYTGGIEIFSAEAELQQTVLQNVPIWNVAFLSDGRCVVRGSGGVTSLYTREWNKIHVWFDSLNEGSSLAVDCDDLIYVGYQMAKKNWVFTPSGGQAVREIPCGGYRPWRISIMKPSRMLVVMTQNYDIRVIDQRGIEVHRVFKDSDTKALCATVCIV